MSSQSLWPSELSASTIKMPYAILQEQAAHFNEQFAGKLQATVTILKKLNLNKDEIKAKITRPTNGLFIKMDIEAPALGNYSFNLLQVDHDFDVYPLELIDSLRTSKTDINDEEQLLLNLKKIFGSSAAKKAITVLLTQVDEVRKENNPRIDIPKIKPTGKNPFKQ